MLIKHLKEAETENVQLADFLSEPNQSNIKRSKVYENITRIIAADDQLINLEVLKYQMSEIGI